MALAIEKELRPQLRHYASGLQQQAAAVAKKRTEKVDLDEVARLRKTVLGLQRRGADFTKQTIIREGDPAIRRLEEICIISAAGDSRAIAQLADGAEADRRAGQALGVVPVADAPAAHARRARNRRRRRISRNTCGTKRGLPPPWPCRWTGRRGAVLAINARLAEKLDPEEARAILACNLMRNLLGLSALAIDPKLCDACARPLEGHGDAEVLCTRVAGCGQEDALGPRQAVRHDRRAENIAMGYHDGRAVNEGWFHSPGHHKNMLTADHVRIGVGRSGVYYSEEFGK